MKAAACSARESAESVPVESSRTYNQGASDTDCPAGRRGVGGVPPAMLDARSRIGSSQIAGLKGQLRVIRIKIQNFIRLENLILNLDRGMGFEGLPIWQNLPRWMMNCIGIKMPSSTNWISRLFVMGMRMASGTSRVCCRSWI